MDRISKILAEPQRARILVVGLGRSGISAALALRKLGAEVIGTDRKKVLEGLEPLIEAGVKLELGGERTELVKRVQLIVISPEVRLRPLAAPVATAAIRWGVPMIPELELGMRLLQTRNKVPIIGITGTNGKSSTASLCTHLLMQGDQSVFWAGHFGRRLCDLYRLEEPANWIVVEASSFQLEQLSSPSVFVPNVGIWLNLTPHHLDRHITMRNYGRITRRMFEGMTSAETGVFFLDDSNVNQQHEGLECTVSGVSRNPARVPLVGALLIRREFTPNGWNSPFVLNNERLLGDHNAENAACAACAALALGLSPEIIQAGLDSFPGLPHRLESVRVFQEIRFYNDSKANTPEATAKSLSAFTDPVVLIVGGKGKGLDYQQLIHPVTSRVKHLILLGEESKPLAHELHGCTRMHSVTDLVEAVRLARELARPGNVVLFSPAGDPLDGFADYQEFGKAFVQSVQGLS